MKDIHSLFLDEILVNIDEVSSIKDFLYKNYVRHRILYKGNTVIDRVIFNNTNNSNIADNMEGEEIEYSIAQLTYYNNENSEIQSMGC